MLGVGAAGEDKVRKQSTPAGAVCISPGFRAAAQPLPTAVLDFDPRHPFNLVKPDLDFGRIGPVDAEVPQVAQPAWRLPHQNLAPGAFLSGGSPLENSAAGPRLQYNFNVGFAGDGMRSRPPRRDLARPHGKRVGNRAFDDERKAQWLNHCRLSVPHCFRPPGENAPRLRPRRRLGTPEPPRRPGGVARRRGASRPADR